MARPISRRLISGLRLIRARQFRTLSKYIYWRNASFLLERNLSQPFRCPAARLALTVRPLAENDVNHLLNDARLRRSDPETASHLLSLLDNGIGRCYVAANAEDEACYVQWIMSAKDNARIQDHFGKGIMPYLDDSTALMEGAYCSPDFRGMHVMPAAMARIADLAREEFGAERALTVVSASNISALRGCVRAGFKPVSVRYERKLLGAHRVFDGDLTHRTLDAFRLSLL